MIFYILALFLISIITVASLYFIFKNKTENTKFIVLKVIALTFFVLFSVRAVFTVDVFEKVISLQSPDFSTTDAALMAIVRWLSYAAALVVSISPFFKSRNQRNLVLFFAFPIALLNIVFLHANFIALSGAEYSLFSLRSVLFSLEQILTLVIAGFLVFSVKHETGFLKDTKKAVLALLLSIGGILLCAIPMWLPQQFFGTTDLEVKFLSIGQHIWLAALAVIYVAIYYWLRKKPHEYKYIFLMFASVATFINYFGHFHIGSLNPSNWPLHICNLATALIPLALVLKNKFLFSFTYYINVAGALVAILIPDLANPILYTGSVRFIHEHTMAFILPILFVALNIFPRTNLKDLKRAIGSFTVYFIIVVIANAWVNISDPTVQFFYLNGEFLQNKIALLGDIKNMWTLTFSFGNLYPLFLLTVYLFFVGLLVVFYFIYRQVYFMEDEAIQINEYKAKSKLDYLDLIKNLNGKPESEPLNKIGGVMLKITNFSKTYGNSKKPVIQNFNLTVKEGEVFGFLGGNGAGKSTTIKSLVGILPFETGTIEVNGYDIIRQPLEAKKQIGYVPDNHAVYEKLTGRQYVNFIADLYSVSMEDRNARIENLLKKFKLESSFDSLIKTYSHGMKQKVTIMGALVHNPKLWVLDEPLTGLDPQSAFEVKEYMREHANAGNTVFFSSHIIEVVEKICDRVAIIANGELQGVYDMKKLARNKESLEQIFLQVTSGNSIEAKKVEAKKKQKKTAVKKGV